MKKTAFILSFTLWASCLVAQKITIPHFFGDNMVLQRDKPIQLWGWASKKGKLSVALDGKVYPTKINKDLSWSVSLPPMGTGGKHILTFATKTDTLSFNNILIGDVWICSGQSNMEWIINKFPYAKDEALKANASHLRLFTVPRDIETRPKKNIKPAQWEEAIGDNILDFSATAYFFGSHLHQESGVPIGLISTSWGGTIAESWTSKEGFERLPAYTEYFNVNKIDEMSIEEATKASQKVADAWMEKYCAQGPGFSDKWHASGNKDNWTDKLSLPVIFDTIPALKGHRGAIWLSRKFTIPAKMKGKDLRFNLSQINRIDQVWINGIKVGESYRAKDWRQYVVSDSVFIDGENEITLRIFYTTDKGGLRHKPSYFNFHEQGVHSGYQMISQDWSFKKGMVVNPDTVPELIVKKLAPNEHATLLYNAMLAPLIPLQIKGFTWYQGESNAKRAAEYATTFPNMIKDWREKFAQGDLPFYFVQLANYRKAEEEPIASDWAELREGQAAALALPNTGMASAIDIGEAGNIHPKNKQEVGRRLALNALKLTYGKNLSNSGPMYKSVEFKDGKAVITFDTDNRLLQTKDKYGYVRGFAIAGADKKFVWAQAEIIDDYTVIVYSDEVKAPTAVRYAWANNPDDASLTNKDGLPAPPFRTDDWELSTKDVRFWIKP